MPTSPPPINPSPQVPQRGIKATFSNLVDAFNTWLALAVAQFGAVALNAYNNALEAFDFAVAASTSATQSAASAGAAAESAAQAQTAVAAASTGANTPMWAAGNFNDGIVVWSPSNRKSYRKVGTGPANTDPAIDSSGAWTFPIYVPGSGGSNANIAANTNVVLTPNSPMVQNLTPLGLGAAVQMPQANLMPAAVAAAYLNNPSAYQLGMRDATGVLKQVIPPASFAQLALADTSSAAGRWDSVLGLDEGFLSMFDKALPTGWSFVTFRPNTPASSGELNKTFLALSPTLVVCLVQNGAATGVLGFNPVTGAMSAVLTLSSVATDRFFTLAKASASTVGVFWAQDSSTTATARVAGKLISFDAALSMTFGATALLPAGNAAIYDVNALVLGGGGVAISIAGVSGDNYAVSGFGVAGLTLTPGAAPSRAGAGYVYVAGTALQLTEVGPNCFAVAGRMANNSTGYIMTFTLNAATGAVALASSQTVTGLGNSATPGQAGVVQIPGTSKYICIWPSSTSQYQAAAMHIFSIASDGTISFINGQTSPNQIIAAWATGGRPVVQAFGGANPGVVVLKGYSTSVALTRLCEHPTTPGLAVSTADFFAAGDYREMQAPVAGTWYFQNGSALCKVTYDPATGNSTLTTLLSVSGALGSSVSYGTVVGSVPVVFSSALVSKRGQKVCAITSAAGSPLQIAVGAGNFDAFGNLLVYADSNNKKFRVLEVAQ